MRKGLLTIAFVWAAGVNAKAAVEIQPWPEFKLAFANEQAVVTGDSINAENSELQAYDFWRALLDDETRLRNELDHAERRHARLSSLGPDGAAKKDDIDLAYVDLVRARNAVKRYPLLVHQARSRLEYYRVRLLDRGNPGADHRRELLLASIQDRLAQKAGLDIDIETIHVTLEISHKRVENARRLFQNHAISQATLEDREFAERDAAAQLKTLENQRQTVATVLDGLTENLDRLLSILNPK